MCGDMRSRDLFPFIVTLYSSIVDERGFPLINNYTLLHTMYALRMYVLQARYGPMNWCAKLSDS